MEKNRISKKILANQLKNLQNKVEDISNMLNDTKVLEERWLISKISDYTKGIEPIEVITMIRKAQDCSRLQEALYTFLLDLQQKDRYDVALELEDIMAQVLGEKEIYTEWKKAVEEYKKRG